VEGQPRVPKGARQEPGGFARLLQILAKGKRRGGGARLIRPYITNQQRGVENILAVDDVRDEVVQAGGGLPLGASLLAGEQDGDRDIRLDRAESFTQAA